MQKPLGCHIGSGVSRGLKGLVLAAKASGGCFHLFVREEIHLHKRTPFLPSLSSPLSVSFLKFIHLFLRQNLFCGPESGKIWSQTHDSLASPVCHYIMPLSIFVLFLSFNRVSCGPDYMKQTMYSRMVLIHALLWCWNCRHVSLLLVYVALGL